MTIENMRNGHGYAETEPTGKEDPLIFPEDASEIMYRTVSEGSCLAEGSVGSGKTHLLHDIGRVARSEYELPTFQFSAHINGGSKPGVANALRELDAFACSRGNNGIILLDNADYFGYSGSKGKRVYGLAVAHTKVARYMVDLLGDDQAPLLAGVAHDTQWRRLKWRYRHKKGDSDEVTPAAQKLLDSFSTRYTFTGEISLETAESMLKQQGFDSAEALAVINRLVGSSNLNYRLAARITPQALEQYGFEGAIALINEGTRKRLGDVALDNGQVLVTTPAGSIKTSFPTS